MRLRAEALEDYKVKLLQQYRAEGPETAKWFWVQTLIDPFCFELFVRNEGKLDLTARFDVRVIHALDEYKDAFRECAMKRIKQYLQTHNMPTALARQTFEMACDAAEKITESSWSG